MRPSPSTEARPAVARLAGSIAEAQRGRARLLHVILTEPSYLEVNRDFYGFAADEPVSIARAERTARERLERFAAEQLGEIPHESGVVVAYDRASGILEEEKSWKPDVITMGTAERRDIERFPLSGFFQLVLGSTAETVARRSHASVVTLRLRA